MICIVNYGLGNVKAFSNVFWRMNIESRIVTSADDLEAASKIILPGVGSFDRAVQLLNASGMREKLENLVLIRRVPILGVCVGMQMLAGGSEEGSLPGLAWIPGQVRSFRTAWKDVSLPTPHMGWNNVVPRSDGGLFKQLSDNPRFYFLHSYFFDCAFSEHVAASTDYGGAFACAVRSDNVWGVQFHPEKSHDHGARLLRNFAEL